MLFHLLIAVRWERTHLLTPVRLLHWIGLIELFYFIFVEVYSLINQTMVHHSLSECLTDSWILNSLKFIALGLACLLFPFIVICIFQYIRVVKRAFTNEWMLSRFLYDRRTLVYCLIFLVIIWVSLIGLNRLRVANWILIH